MEKLAAFITELENTQAQTGPTVNNANIVHDRGSKSITIHLLRLQTP